MLTMERNRFTTALYLIALAVGVVVAYKLGALWVQGENSVSAPHAEQQAITTPPRTIDFQLEGNINSAWDIPAFSLEDTNGKTHSLSDWKGKVIMVNFWATWCPPCKYEIPEFIEYQDQYGNDGFQIIGIGIDDPNKIKNFARTLEINYPVLLATSSAIMADWGNSDQVLPYSVVIDRDGSIRYIHRGQLSKLSFDSEIKPIILE